MDVSLLQPIMKRLINLENQIHSGEISSTVASRDIQKPNIDDIDIYKKINNIANQKINTEISSMKQSIMRAVNIKIETLINEKINEVSKTIDNIKNEIHDLKMELVNAAAVASKKETKEVTQQTTTPPLTPPPPTPSPKVTKTSKKKTLGASVDI